MTTNTSLKDEIFNLPRFPEDTRLSAFSDEERFQLRVATNADAIERYTERYIEGGAEAMPPVVAVELPVENPTLSARVNADGEAVQLFLVDGFHRFRAARKAGLEKIPTIIISKIPGKDMVQVATQLAMEYNAGHGAAYTQADRRNAVRRFLELFPGESLRWIAQQTGVSKSTVDNIKKAVDGRAQIQRAAIKVEEPETGRCVQCAFCHKVSVASALYYERDPDPTSWHKGEDGRWYCSEDCEQIAKEERLEKEADKILDKVKTEDFTDADDDEDEDDQDAVVESSTARIDAPRDFQLRRDPNQPIACRVCRQNVRVQQDIRSERWFVRCEHCLKEHALMVSTKGYATREEALRAWNLAMGLIYH